MNTKLIEAMEHYIIAEKERNESVKEILLPHILKELGLMSSLDSDFLESFHHPSLNGILTADVGRVNWIKQFRALTKCSLKEGLDECNKRFKRSNYADTTNDKS